jgi:hypothetical protein
MHPIAAGLALALLLADPAAARCVTGDGAWITRACYDSPKDGDLYRHSILGATPEWSRLVITLGPEGRSLGRGATVAVSTPRGHLFEDIAPHLADLDGDGRPEVMAVETDHRRGARLLAVFLDGRSAATAYIGTPRRWLAPIGALDADGDGRAEFAYVETPHLGKTLRLVRLDGTRLRSVAEAPGLTVHRIGDRRIEGRIATCEGRPTVLTLSADWTRIMATTLRQGRMASEDRGPHAGPGSLADLPGCD